MLCAVNRSCLSFRLSVSLLALVVAAIQLGDRLGLVVAPILTGSDTSMQQYESFRAHAERDGHHNLVVLGNSIARQSVNIRRLRRELEPRLGRTIAGYHFAAGGDLRFAESVDQTIERQS